MNEKEFVQWLRGFLEGIHHYNITPAQLDLLKDKLSDDILDIQDNEMSKE